MYFRPSHQYSQKFGGPIHGTESSHFEKEAGSGRGLGGGGADGGGVGRSGVQSPGILAALLIAVCKRQTSSF